MSLDFSAITETMDDGQWRSRRWIDKLPVDVQNDLKVIRAKFRDSGLSKKPFAESLLAHLKAEGLSPLPGPRGIIDWLSLED